MKPYQIDLKFVRSLAFRFLFTGIALIVLGILISIYPALLTILVAVSLVLSGIMFLSLAHKINHYSKIRIKF